MSRALMPNQMVGNEFVVQSRPRLVPAAALPVLEPVPATAPIIMSPVVIAPHTDPPVPPPHNFSAPDFHLPHISPFESFLDLIHRYSLVVFALLFLLIGVSGVQVGKVYWSAYVARQAKTVAATIKAPVRIIAGLNITVPANQLDTRLQTITGQPATIMVGDQSETISPDTIKSWLQITPSADKSQDYIRIKADAISKTLSDMANQSVQAPVDQVTSTSGGSSAVIVAGSNGVSLADAPGLKRQADDIAKTVMDGKGMQFNAPLTTQAFASVTPAAFDKLIEVNVVSKQMWLYDHGNLYKQYPISAGAPATPTPIGEFHIYSKLTVQDMTGFNANGTKYFQPHVHWINYFLPGGYAVHGNYWRPQSWFGAINSSHGCVSLPDDQAEEVYDWAPLGTTVITHA